MKIKGNDLLTMHMIFLMRCKSLTITGKHHLRTVRAREDFGDVFVYFLILIRWYSDVLEEELLSLFPFYRDDFADSHREKCLN